MRPREIGVTLLGISFLIALSSSVAAVATITTLAWNEQNGVYMRPTGPFLREPLHFVTPRQDAGTSIPSVIGGDACYWDRGFERVECVPLAERRCAWNEYRWQPFCLTPDAVAGLRLAPNIACEQSTTGLIAWSFALRAEMQCAGGRWVRYNP